MVPRTKAILTRRPRTIKLPHRRRPILTRNSTIRQVIRSQLFRRTRLRNLRTSPFRGHVQIRRICNRIRAIRIPDRRQRHLQRRGHHNHIQRQGNRQLAHLLRTNSLLAHVPPWSISTSNNLMRRPPNLYKHRITFHVTRRRQHTSRLLRLNSAQQRHQLQRLRFINDRHRLTRLMCNSRNFRRERRNLAMHYVVRRCFG